MAGKEQQEGSGPCLFQGGAPIISSDTVKKMTKTLVTIIESLAKIRTVCLPNINHSG
jgi:hypothetical protein